MPYFLACVGDVNDPGTGYFGAVALPPLGFGEIVGESTVIAEGRPVATVGMAVTSHGNPVNPKLPGYNPTCASAVVTGFKSAYNVLVNGKPAAVVGAGGGTMFSCTHYCVGPGAPTVIVGDSSVG